ncbi:hypothetical protein FRX31_017311 [Thalictrum thalictroides]|uniref:Uncharacterized protein n=1 Tax=Thalictrum thalictroides TaxID=46969 RepID=A0A7J6WA64_THATH|nr:hypothetical protein FRX31_017311 [Thalictrum thalictroides]
MAPLTRGMAKGKGLQTKKTPQRTTRSQKPQTKVIPPKRRKVGGQRLQPKKTTTTSMLTWEMLEELVEETGVEGPFPDEPPTPGI